LWALFSWELIISKKWVKSLILLIMSIVAYAVPFLFKYLPNSFSFFNIVFSPYGFLVIAWTYLLNKRENQFLKYLIGIIFVFIWSFSSYRAFDLISIHNWNYELSTKLVSFLLLLISYYFLYYFIILFDRISMREIVKNYLNPLNDKISRSEFLWNYLLNYTFAIVIYFAINSFLNYFSIYPLKSDSFANIVEFLLIFSPFVLCGINFISTSISWLKKNKKAIPWNLFFLSLPLLNLITLYQVTKKKRLKRHISKFKTASSLISYEQNGNNSCNYFLILIHAVAAIMLIFSNIKLIKINRCTSAYIMIILTILNLIFFIAFTKNKKYVYALSINAIVIFVVHLFIDGQKFNEAFSAMLFSIVSYWFLINIVHPLKIDKQTVS